MPHKNRILDHDIKNINKDLAKIYSKRYLENVNVFSFKPNNNVDLAADRYTSYKVKRI